MNTRTTFSSLESAQDEIMRQYDAGYTYVAGTLNGIDFKVRMNKDHGMKDWNNGISEHVLSLVNGDCDSRNGENVLGQWLVQVRVNDREEMLYEVEDFLKGLADYEE